MKVATLFSAIIIGMAISHSLKGSKKIIKEIRDVVNHIHDTVDNVVIPELNEIKTAVQNIQGILIHIQVNWKLFNIFRNSLL